MEHRRRTLSSAIDDDLPRDIELNAPRRRGTSASLDDEINQFTDYMYAGSFNLSTSVFRGFINLIQSICYCYYCRRISPEETH